jgi:membrane protease YdiL (CAAX protease family)
MTARRARGLLVAVLLATWGGAFAALARAEEPVPAEAARDEPVPSDLILPEIARNPNAVLAMCLVLGGAGLLGVVLLVRQWLRWDRIRGGLLPMPTPVVPTAPFRLDVAVGLVILSMAATLLVSSALLRANDVDPKDLGARLPYLLAVQAGFGLPLAAIVGLRRLRLASPPPPPLGRAALVGAWTWCVAVVVVVPVGVVASLVLNALGHRLAPQELVTLALDPGTASWKPVAIAAYGVLVAPAIEESLFRGMLYPAIRRQLGGTRRAVWIAAVVTALLFAAVHAHVAALLPLFALAMVFALVFERTNSLAAVICAHGLYNLGSMVPVLVARFT